VPAGLLTLAIGQGVGVGGERVEHAGANSTGRPRRARIGALLKENAYQNAYQSN
jgi:hypothetical protein